MERKSFIRHKMKVSKYKNPNLSIKERFAEEKEQKWVNDYNNFVDEKNFIKSTFMLAKLLKFDWRIYPHKSDIDSLIHCFTLKDISDEDVDSLMEKTKRRNKNYIKDIQRENRDKLTVKLKNREINMIRLTHFFNLISDATDAFDTTRRFGNCHWFSIDLARSHASENRPCDLVTGEVFTIHKKAKCLHSWIEFPFKDDIYVADGTKNIVMKKEDFYYLLNVNPLQRIDAKTIYADEPMVSELTDICEWYSKLYLVSPEEARELYKKLILSKKDEQNQEKNEENEKE